MTKEAIIYNEEKTVSSISGELNNYMWKDEIRTFFNTIHKNPKWIKQLNVRLDIIKLLEENIGKILLDINLSNIFFDSSPSVMKIRTKINKWDLIKLKSFCISKETMYKMKRQPTKWEKIFVNYAFLDLKSRK